MRRRPDIRVGVLGFREAPGLLLRVGVDVRDGLDLIGRVVMSLGILFQAIPVAFLVRIVALDAAFKQAILADIVVLANVRGVVPRMRMGGGFRCSRVGGGGGPVELLVARVVRVPALVVSHR